MKVKQISITKLNPAAYNPRKITDKQLSYLKKSLKEFGDLSGIIFNRRTGNVIGGHQRLKCLPEDAKIEKNDLKTPTKTGTVAHGFIIIEDEKYTYREVDWDDATEKMANIAANKHGGNWDDEKLSLILHELSEMPIFDLDLIGFETTEFDEILKDGELQEITEDIKFYKMSHILISFPPGKLLKISTHLEKIFAIEGIEHEQSSN